MFGKTIWLSKCQVTSSSEDLILLPFYLQMLNKINVKNSWESLKCRFQLIIKSREKMLQPMKTACWEKWAENFKTLASTLCKIALKYLNFWDESCEIRIFSSSIIETYTLRQMKNQFLLLLSSWEYIPRCSG